MTSNLWFFYALGASMLWGIGYALSEKILKDSSVSPAFLILATEIITLPMYVLLVYYLGQFKAGIEALSTNRTVLAMIVICSFVVVGGNFLILNSVLEKNATLTSLIEITYPLFVVFFVWLFFKDVQLSWSTAIGGLLIFSGVAVIYLKS